MLIQRGAGVLIFADAICIMYPYVNYFIVLNLVTSISTCLLPG